MNNISATYSKSDRVALYFVAWMWSFGLWPYVLSVVRRTPVLSVFTDYITQIISIVLALLAISYNKNKLKNSDIIFCVGIMIVYFMHEVLFPNNFEYLRIISPIFFYTCLPYFFVGLFLNFDKQKTVLEYISIAVIILTLIYRYIFRVQVGEDLMDSSREDMGEAYRLLPHMLLLMYSVFQKFNVWKTIVVIIAFVIISGTGNRGSLLLMALFIVLYFILLKHYKRPVLSRIFIVAAGILAISYLPAFAQYFSETLLGLDIGFNDRAFQYYLEGEIAWDNGRNDIREAILAKIVESPIWGFGLCADRVFIGTWSHNILVELWVSFGYLFGTLLFVSLVVVIIQGYLSCETVDQKGMLIILFLLGFALLFISNSFLQNRFFWFLLGYTVCLKRNKKERVFLFEKSQMPQYL